MKQLLNTSRVPKYRKETVLPAGGVNSLANNFFINCMVDDLMLKRKVDGEEKVKCNICDENDPVIAYCTCFSVNSVMNPETTICYS